jgi:septum formation protein
MNDASHQIYLASRSPRRSELLAQIGIRFAALAADTDESRLGGESPDEYVRRVALEKARLVRGLLPDEDQRPVLAADTAVVLGDRTFGKPTDGDDAARMLRALSGRAHQVLTAVAVISQARDWLAVSESRVTFRSIRDDEIDRYCRSVEPLDKAGGYAIQGHGALFISHMEGSYSGVMGLPLFETGQLLELAGIELIPVPAGFGRSD